MTITENEVLDLIKGKALKLLKKGKYYYYVPTTMRRNCQMLVPTSIIKKLIKDKRITAEDLPQIPWN